MGAFRTEAAVASGPFAPVRRALRPAGPATRVAAGISRPRAGREITRARRRPRQGEVVGGDAVEADCAMFQADAEGTGSLYSSGTCVAGCELAGDAPRSSAA